MTSATARTPAAYIAALPKPRRGHILALHRMIQQTVPKLRPYIVSGMIGCGSYHYRYASGREGDWPVIALASQKNYISVYVCAASGGKYVAERYQKELAPASVGKSCIRFNRPEDINLNVFRKVIREGARASLRMWDTAGRR